MDKVLFCPLFVTLRERKGFARAMLDAWFDRAPWIIDAHSAFWPGVVREDGK
jgi:hypothetical protein